MQAKRKSTAGLYAALADNVVKCMDFGLRPFGVMRKNTLMSVMAERMVPEIAVPVQPEKELKFWGFGGWSSYRGRSVLDKEPLTIQWIDRMEKGSVFWDIGANIGAFSIYAAAVRGIRTFSFEPSLANIAVFAKNIELNGVDALVTALPAALSDKTGLSVLNLQSTVAGNTGAQFSAGTVDAPTVFSQACLGWTIDDFIAAYNPSFPNYIKIDVDGQEAKILAAAPKTLADPRLKSLILEFDPDSEDFKIARDLLEKNGFKLTDSDGTVQGRNTIKNFIFSR